MKSKQKNKSWDLNNLELTSQLKGAITSPLPFCKASLHLSPCLRADDLFQVFVSLQSASCYVTAWTCSLSQRHVAGSAQGCPWLRGIRGDC